MHGTIGGLIKCGRQLEIGCHACRFHIYVDAGEIPVAAETQIPALSKLLRCPQCHAVNVEHGYPLWTRPDARPPKMGAG